MTTPDLRSRRGAALRRLVLAVALAGVGAGSLAGCTKDTSDQLKGAIEEELKERLKKKKRATADQTEAQPELLINKLSLYLDCASETQAIVRESHRVYRRRVPAEGSILAGGEAIPTVPEAARGRCQAAVKSGRQLQPPQPELEAAMADYAEALDAYATRVGEIAAMLAARGDEVAGKKIDPATEATIRELDASVEAAFGAWEDASTSLTREINATQERLDTAVLGRIEGRAGKRVEYFTRAFVIASRPLVRCLSADPGIACEAAFFTLEQAHGELHGYLDVHQEEAAEVFWIEPFVASADQYYEAARGLMSKVRGGTIGKDDVDAVIDEFNDLLRDADNLSFKRLAGGG